MFVSTEFDNFETMDSIQKCETRLAGACRNSTVMFHLKLNVSFVCGIQFRIASFKISQSPSCIFIDGAFQ